jgi:hypothetical protein
LANLAKGHYAFFLDPDDAIVPDAIIKIVEFALKNPGYSMYQSKLMICDESLNIVDEDNTSREIPENRSYLTVWPNHHISHLCLFDIPMYKKTEGINDKYPKAVDKDLYFKLEEIAPSIYFPEKPLYFYRIHKGGISTFSNWYPANYWTLKAMFDAYKRRKKTKNLNNISIKELRNFIVFYNKNMIYDSIKNRRLKWIVIGYIELLKHLNFFKIIKFTLKLYK